MIDISFSQPKRKQSNETIPIISRPTKQIKTLPQKNEDVFFGKLKEILPNSGVLTAVEAMAEPSMKTDARIVRKLPPLLTAR